MKFFVNAYTMRIAGGLSIGLNFIKYLKEYNTTDEFDVLVPPNLGYEELASSNVNIIPISQKLINPLLKYYTNRVYLPRLAKRLNPDAIFSMGNIGFKTNKPQIILYELPHGCYDQVPHWGKLTPMELLYAKLSIKEVKSNLKYVDLICLQTESFKNRFAERFGVPQDRLTIVPNAVSLNAKKSENIDVEFFKRVEGSKYFVYLSKYYAHKNYEVLIPLAEIVKKEKLGYKFIITINKDQGNGAITFLNDIKRLKLEDIIINLGVINHKDVPSLYNQCDAALIPTILESFTGTYVESMYYEKPIFTSEIDFATGVCQDAAFYFDPFSPDDILEKLSIINDTEKVYEKVSKGSALLKTYPGWDKVGEMFVENMRKLVN